MAALPPREWHRACRSRTARCSQQSRPAEGRGRQRRRRTQPRKPTEEPSEHREHAADRRRGEPWPDAPCPGAGGQLGHVPWSPHNARGPERDAADGQLGRGQVHAVRCDAAGLRCPAEVQRGGCPAVWRCGGGQAHHVYVYARQGGRQSRGEGSASAFQRPGATWSAVALTFDNAAGTRVTISALFDLPKNGTESSVGRFYLIDHAPLDLEALEGIAD